MSGDLVTIKVECTNLGCKGTVYFSFLEGSIPSSASRKCPKCSKKITISFGETNNDRPLPEMPSDNQDSGNSEAESVVDEKDISL